MKTLTFCLIVTTLFFLSCSDDEYSEPRDHSLVGSISYDISMSIAEVAMYEDGIRIVDGLENFYPYLIIGKNGTPDHIGLNYLAYDYSFTLWNVPVFGVPYDVTFSYESGPGEDTLLIKGETIYPKQTRFSGWMTSPDKDNFLYTRGMILAPAYNGELKAEFVLEDGREVTIEFTLRVG